MSENTIRCCAKVSKGSNGWRTRYDPCSHAAKVERDGKWYCGQHDPKARETKLQAKIAKRSAQHAYEARRSRLADAAPDLLAAVKALLDMHIAHHNSPVHAAARAAIVKAEGND